MGDLSEDEEGAEDLAQDDENDSWVVYRDCSDGNMMGKALSQLILEGHNKEAQGGADKKEADEKEADGKEDDKEDELGEGVEGDKPGDKHDSEV